MDKFFFSPLKRRHDLPRFLRRFTAPYRSLRVLILVIDLFEKQRNYDEAIELIKYILSINMDNTVSQEPSFVVSETCPLDILGPCHLGKLLIRLIVNQGTHKRQPVELFKFINQFLNSNNGLARSCLRAGPKCNINDQLSKLLENLKTTTGKQNLIKSKKRKRCEQEEENKLLFENFPIEDFNNLNLIENLKSAKVVILYY